MRVNLILQTSILVPVTAGLAFSTMLGISVQGGPPRTQDQVDQLFKQAQVDVAKGNYDAAADKYRAALTLEPRSPQAMSNLGVSLYMSGHTREAVEPLLKALRIDPSQLPANLILGMAYVKLNEFEKALPPLQRVLQQDGKNRDAFFALASAYFGLRQSDKAGEVYARELKIFPKDSEAWYGAGLCFEQVAEDAARELAEVGKSSFYNQRLLGEYLTEKEAGIEAEDALRHAIALGGTEQEGLHAALGFALLRLDEDHKALTEFQSELRLHPGSLDGKLGLAATGIRQRRFAEGFEQLCEVFKTHKEYFRSHVSFFVTFLRPDFESGHTESGSKEGVSASCQRALELIREELIIPGSAFDLEAAFQPLGSAPSAPLPQRVLVDGALGANQLGRYADCRQTLERVPFAAPGEGLRFARCASLSGRYMMSLEASRKVLSKDPHNLEGYYWQVESARNLAKSAFQRAMSLNPNSWQGQLLLGDIYRQRKDWDAAISHYNEATQLKPTSAAAFLGLATLYWENGWFDRANVALHKVLELDPENAQANLELGDIYVRSHRYEEALPILQKCLARDTHHSLLVHADLGKSYAESGLVDRAIAELTQASSSDRSGEIHYQLYKLYQKKGQSKLGQEALVESERLRAQDAQERQNRINRAAQLGKGNQTAQQ